MAILWGEIVDPLYQLMFWSFSLLVIYADIVSEIIWAFVFIASIAEIFIKEANK